MLDVMSLRKDSDFQTKSNLLENLQKEGFIDQIRAQLRSQVIKALEKEKKNQFGGASKYLQQSELSNPVTKKVISQPDGLLCAEIIKEFLTFFQMTYSLGVFVPEMSMSAAFPKSRSEIEREIGVAEAGDTSKPLLLKLIEQIKYGPQPTSSNTVFGKPTSLSTFSMSSEQPMMFEDPFKKHQQPVEIPSAKPEQKEIKKNKSKKKKDSTKTKKEEKVELPKASQQSLTKLDNLPSFGKPVNTVKDPYDFDLDDVEESSHREENTYDKYSKAQRLLKDQQEEEHKGYNMKAPVTQQNKGKAPITQTKVDIIDDYEDDFIDEEIQSEHDNWKQNLAESGNNFGVTVSQSLGIDPSVDSLALDDYDHIEHVDF